VNANDPGFNSADLLTRLKQLPATRRFWIGFSGGADSTALLLAMHELRDQIEAQICAIHFNHGLQVEADEWQQHCRSFCQQRGIEFHLQALQLDQPGRQSQEQYARQQRYNCMEKLLADGEIFLTAHHADDNAETLILNLMRGSGVDGLAAIPPLRKINNAWVARPLLDFSRKDLEQYLQRKGITWFEDPSNLDLSYDRNYVRKQLFPELDQRWPGVVKRLNRTAVHVREFSSVTSTMLRAQYHELLSDGIMFPLKPLVLLNVETQSLLLRQWFRLQDLPFPPRQRLAEFLSQINSGEGTDRRPELRWAGNLVKQHGNELWLQQEPYPDLCPEQSWQSGMSLELGPDFGQVQLCGKSVSIPSDWKIGPGNSGSRLKMHAGGPGRRLKDLLRESGLPPWLRKAIPVLYWQDDIAAIGDCILSHDLREFLLQHSLTYHWLANHPLLCKLQSVSVQHLGPADTSNEN
jgi:tRNA(Ile)-lysidine synthase